MKVAAGSYDINWGVSSLYNNLFRGVAEKGAIVDVYSREKISEEVGPLDGRLRFHQIKIPEILKKSDTLTRFYFNYRFYKQAGKKDFDLIHGLCFNLYPCHKLGIPYLLDDIVYPTYMEFIKTEIPKLGTWTYRRTIANMLPFMKTVKTECENADALVVPNEFQKRKLMECFYVDEAKIRLIPYGIRTPETQGGDKKEDEDGLNVILFVGNDYLRKGLHYLIEAMEEVIKTHPQTILICVGGQVKNQARSKPTLDYITKLIKEKRLTKNIFFKGQLSFEETQKYFDLCDVFCLPTLSDSCSRAVLEAVSHETPVVTTPEAGFPDADKAGIQIPSRSPQAIAEAVLTLLGNDKLRKKKKEFCRTAIEKYSWTKIAGAYAKLYEDVSGIQPG